MVKLASSRVFRCLMCLLLICCMLVNISPVRAHATAISSATAVGIAAALVVGSILIGLDIMPSSSVLSSSFQNLVNAIDCYLKIFSMEDLVRELGNRAVKMSPKYERLLAKYKLLTEGSDDHGN